MQFSCYRCGLLFRKGPPPMEALSRSQTPLVGVTFDGDPAEILEGTVYEGLSVHNLCMFCLQFVVSYRFLCLGDSGPGYLHVGRQQGTMYCSQCEAQPRKQRDWVFTNRWVQFHMLEHLGVSDPDLFALSEAVS